MYNWKVSKRLGLTIQILNNRWIWENQKDIQEWLTQEGVGNISMGLTLIFLYSEEQMAYFKLRWG